MRTRPTLLLASLALVSCFVLGGATHSGYLADALLQAIAIPVLLLAIWWMPRPEAGRGDPWLIAMMLAAVALPLIQLVPLPPSVWTRLPGHQSIVAAFGAIGSDLPWMPLSLTPRQTWLSALSMLPPLALLLATLQLDYHDRRRFSVVVLGAGVIEATLGMLQVAQGPASRLRPFSLGSDTEAVGFFANRNHFAALIYCLIPIIAVWAADATTSIRGDRKQALSQTSVVIPLVACFVALVTLIGAAAMARSRAGMGLTIAALLGAVAVGLADRRRSAGITPARLIAGAVALAVTFTVQLALYRVLERFGGDPIEDARLVFTPRTFEAAKSFMPFGAGMGSFVQVYPMFERVRDTLLDTYANRAHDDIVELWLEGGAAAFALQASFLAWLGVRSWSVWRGVMPGAGALDLGLARAATVTIVLLLVHSFVDYPLRTEAMLAMLVFATVSLVSPPSGSAQTLEPEQAIPAAPEHKRKRRSRHRSSHGRGPSVEIPTVASSPESHGRPGTASVAWPGRTKGDGPPDHPADQTSVTGVDAWPAEWNAPPGGASARGSPVPKGQPGRRNSED